MIARCIALGLPIADVPIRTIYAGEPSHIRPVAPFHGVPARDPRCATHRQRRLNGPVSRGACARSAPAIGQTHCPDAVRDVPSHAHGTGRRYREPSAGRWTAGARYVRSRVRDQPGSRVEQVSVVQHERHGPGWLRRRQRRRGRRRAVPRRARQGDADDGSRRAGAQRRGDRAAPPVAYRRDPRS